MKNILKRVPKKLFVAAATVALVAGVASQTMAGFGPNRPTRAWSDGLNGFDYVTFNSFTGVPAGVGDERNFLRGVQVGRDSVWSDPVTGVENNAEVEMKIYIHNNASSTLNASGEGVAKDVKVRAALPTGSAQAQQVTSYISASNAQPKEIYDTLDLTGANNGYFELDYIPGSAKMFNHENGQTTAISDNLVTTGVTLPDQKGCFEYVREITFRVKVKMPSWSTQKTARLHGEDSTKWRQTVNAKVGDKVDYRIWFKNAGTTQLNSVKVVDNLPPYTTVVPGSVKLYNGNYPLADGGYTYPASAIQNNGKQINVDIGAYAPGADAYVVFTVEIQKAKEISCGVHQLINVVTTTPQGYGAASDKAYVNVINDEKCEEEEPASYICESLTVEKLGGRKVRVTLKAPASNGATFKNAIINFGDGSEAKVTNQLVNEHTYAADRTYRITAEVVFTVNGEDKKVTSDACAATVSFETTPPPELPKTGAGNLIGLFAVVTLAAAAAHNMLSRRASL